MTTLLEATDALATTIVATTHHATNATPTSIGSLVVFEGVEGAEF